MHSRSLGKSGRGAPRDKDVNKVKHILQGLTAAAMFAVSPVQAGGLGLPVGVGPIGPVNLPRVPIVPGVLNTATGTLDSTLGIVRDTVGRPQRTISFDRDTQGFKVLRQTVLALSPDDQSLSIARGLSFQIVREQPIASLGLTVVQLRAPESMNATEAVVASSSARVSASFTACVT